MKRLGVASLAMALMLVACGREPDSNATSGPTSTGPGSLPESTLKPTEATTVPTTGGPGIFAEDTLDGFAGWHVDRSLSGWAVEELQGDAVVRFTHEETGCLVAYLQGTGASEDLSQGRTPFDDLDEYSGAVREGADFEYPQPTPVLSFLTYEGDLSFEFAAESFDLDFGRRNQHFLVAAAWIGDVRLVTSVLCDTSVWEDTPEVVEDRLESTTIIVNESTTDGDGS